VRSDRVEDAGSPAESGVPAAGIDLDKRPHAHVRRILFTVCGLSPQVVTETIYALAVSAPPDERFIPTEVHVLTTTEGAQRVRLALLSEQPGCFERLRSDYELPPITFGSEQIHLVRDASGEPLADIRTESDNACMADAVTELVRRFTADDHCALHVSIAGGRKTMGFYAGYALSLFGREQDRLSHVLVSAPFESSWEFFYPTPRPQVIATRDGRDLADASTAEVRLAEIPFVRLRQGLPRALLEGRNSFADTVAAANARLVPPTLRLDVAQRSVVADGHRLPLTPTQFALIAALAQRARQGKPALPAPLRDQHDPAWAEELLGDLRAAVGLMHMPNQFEDSLRQDCSGSKVSPHLSRLRSVLREALPPGRDALYFDDGAPQRPKRYRIPLAPESITVVLPDAPTSAASLQSDAPR